MSIVHCDDTLHRRLLHTVIIGGGPAGCGLLTNFALNEEYKTFLSGGVAIIESGAQLGGGSIDAYSHLRSNSHGCAFFDAFEGLGIEAHDSSLNIKAPIPMGELHRLQDTIGLWHQENLNRHPISRALTNMRVVDVRQQIDGSYCVRYTPASGQERDASFYEVMAGNICICTGGIPYTPSWLLDRNVRGEAAHEYFSGTRAPDSQAKSIAIIGYSHSAFSLGHQWQKHCPNTNITFIRRPTLKSSSQAMPHIYFSSTEAAKVSKYPFTSDDVCAETNRVHRFGGLREDAREFALQTQAYTVKPATDFHPQDYDRIIVACGLQMRSIPIWDRHGTPLYPEFNGGTVVDAQGCLFAGHRIYAFGIGAGLRPDSKTGGEPGCTRRSDGIWLYQHTVGSVVRTSLMSRANELVPKNWSSQIYNQMSGHKSLINPPLLLCQQEQHT